MTQPTPLSIGTLAQQYADRVQGIHCRWITWQARRDTARLRAMNEEYDRRFSSRPPPRTPDSPGRPSLLWTGVFYTSLALAGGWFVWCWFVVLTS